VATTGTNKESGLFVQIDLGNGYTVSFSHLSDVPGIFKDAQGNIDHSKSAEVNAGDIIGFVGATGNADTSGRDSHTHVRTKENGKDINPRAFYSNERPVP
jgi:murein DD-endopeptidase MepM/ murein hydrolase activator NlpD